MRAAYRQRGVPRLYTHQLAAAEALHNGNHVIVSTGTASGKSLATQLAGISAIAGAEPTEAVRAHPSGAATMLYISPTKALAADQAEGLHELAELLGGYASEGSDRISGGPSGGVSGGLRPEIYDGDTDTDHRRWIRQHSNFVLTNPDMLNAGILPNHKGWARFFSQLRYVIIDEAHTARGIFGSHIALLLRRLRRVAAVYGAEPIFAGASATSGDPARSFAQLIGAAPDEVTAVEVDGSPHGPVDVYLWESAPSEATGDQGAPLKLSIVAETADLLTELVIHNRRSLAFIKSRRGAETISTIARDNLAQRDASLMDTVTAYRSGYLAHERRDIEERLRRGTLLGVASTPALELGIDISGLDVVLIAGWPGTRASFFQQLGRAGRPVTHTTGTQTSVESPSGAAFFIAGDDPLDSYLVEHPEAIFDLDVEDAVTDPMNPHVAAAHLLAAAQESPLSVAEMEPGGLLAGYRELVDSLTAQGHLRRRPRGWFFAHENAAASSWVSLRSDGGSALTILQLPEGAVIGDIGSAQACAQAHPGAVYIHQGRSYLVQELDLEQRIVFVEPAVVPYYTQARATTAMSVLDSTQKHRYGMFTAEFGTVEVTSSVIGFQRKALGSSEVLSEEPLDMPPQQLRTQAIWITLAEQSLLDIGIPAEEIPGTLHAAEHAMIGLLPLLTSSDRWDIGGVSTALHRDTQAPSIFVYDGHPGGAGFAQRGYQQLQRWVQATAETIASCDCAAGCPRCVQSPKCGNKNSPLSKSGALTFLTALRDAILHTDTREKPDIR